MGCDIHLHIEVRIKGVWEHWGCPRIDRDYAMFARMAGVRGENEEGQIAERKGVPHDMTNLTKIDYEDYGTDAHSASWFNWQEIQIFSKWLRKDHKVHGLDYDLEFSVLQTYLFGNSFTGWAEYPDENRQGVEDVRFVFWFDN